MATVSRQPFAPVDGARLKSLASIKNRQNALSSSPGKRKASDVSSDDDNSENIAPVLFLKRSKGFDPWNVLSEGFRKHPAFTLTTKVASSPASRDVLSSPPSKLSSPRPRAILQPKSPAARLKVKSTGPPPLPPPAGRSPTRASKRMGILSRRRTQRPDPPSFRLRGGAAVPFSLDAALKGTIPSYSGGIRKHNKSTKTTASNSSSSSRDFFLPTPDMKSSLCFDIHEDTPEQEMTNLLQHGTCTLDISSDEESESRASRDRAEGRDKENIPPPEDVSQTSSARGSGAAVASRVEIDEDVLLLKGRDPLAEMNVSDFYAEGFDSASVFIVPADEEEDREPVVDEAGAVAAEELPPLPQEDESEQRYLFADDEGAPPHKHDDAGVDIDSVAEAADVDDIMGCNDAAADAAVLGPAEGTTSEGFELWESHSAKDEGDAPPSPVL